MQGKASSEKKKRWKKSDHLALISMHNNNNNSGSSSSSNGINDEWFVEKKKYNFDLEQRLSGELCSASAPLCMWYENRRTPIYDLFIYTTDWLKE